MGDFAGGLWVRARDALFDLSADLVHDYLFLTPHFPVFTVLQLVFICSAARKGLANKAWTCNIATTFLMAFAGRTAAALLTRRPTPLFENEYYVPLFLLVWFLVNCSPFDAVYRLIDTRVCSLVLQLAYGLIQVRETCHGVDIGLKRYHSSAVGPVLISFLLSSAESFIWVLKNKDVRFFSTKVILRNVAFSIAYMVLTGGCAAGFSYDRGETKIALWALTSVVTVVDCALFGIVGNGAVDVTLLSYLSYVVEYKGDK